MQWVFEYHTGYTDVRAWAGLAFAKRYPEAGHVILEKLIGRDNPDNRDTALAVLVQLQNPARYELAKPLLQDSWPYLRLEAVDMLKEIYPAETRQALQELQNHPESWVRVEVANRLKPAPENLQRVKRGA